MPTEASDIPSHQRTSAKSTSSGKNYPAAELQILLPTHTKTSFGHVVPSHNEILYSSDLIDANLQESQRICAMSPPTKTKKNYKTGHLFALETYFKAGRVSGSRGWRVPTLQGVGGAVAVVHY